ncbi:hypothetical protein [Vibrio porteresiae]|uniref:Uncharacterized protein n=1 Tax=Vibrio porteresiae DSM 19223 TaxID=1123496 RepID=A0ABZ0Q8W4_9VIBR|nr:hypothetical protein [Vibrio porteresiae]WPC72878.1 hypothetical protein R8Z52_12160 [Vibrio porteresiae DSM 19223]
MQRLGNTAQKTIEQRQLTWDSNAATIVHLLAAHAGKSSYAQ